MAEVVTRYQGVAVSEGDDGGDCILVPVDVLQNGRLHAHILKNSARTSWTVAVWTGAGRMHHGLWVVAVVAHDLQGVMASPA